MLEGRYCDYCGKNFFPTKYHAYKQEFDYHTKWFCKYSCMLRYREKHQKKKENNHGHREGT